MLNTWDKIRDYFGDIYRELGWWKFSLVVVAVAVVVGLTPSFMRTMTQYAIPIDQLSSMAAQARSAGDNKLALELYKTVSTRASATDYSSNFEIGNLYYEIRNWGEAERYYLRAASNPSALPQVFYQLSDLYIQHLPAKQTKFIDLVQKSMAGRTDDAGLRIVLADFYQKTNNTAEAINWYKQALALDPDNQAIKDKIKELEAK